MASKPEIVRALDGLPQDSLKEVKKFIDSLKKSNGKKHASGNVEVVAKKQISAIKKWAGRTLTDGFSGRDHDVVLYRKDL